MSSKLPVNGFKRVEQKKSSKFNEDFIKNYDENGDIGYFLEVDTHPALRRRGDVAATSLCMSQ